MPAAGTWLGRDIAPLAAPTNLLLDGLVTHEMEALIRAAERSRATYRMQGARAWIGGTAEEILRVASALRGSPGREIIAACAAQQGPYPRPLVMGILNVTPDSFSDGGQWMDPGAAVEHALKMVEDGADVIDIGGESTRPGAVVVPADEELARVLPVLKQLRSQTTAQLSIDTRKSPVAAACLEAGADWINDVSGLTYDPALAEVVARYPGCRLVLMHSRARGSAEVYSTEWDDAGRPVYEDVVADTLRWLRRQAQVAVERGVDPRSLWLDPGYGFGKTYEQNVDLLRRLREYTSTGLPVLIGTSRKSSVGKMLGDLPPDQRLEGTAATVAWAITQRASAVRVHDVREMARVAKVTTLLCTDTDTDH